MPLGEKYTILLIFVFLLIACGWQAYIAWFRPSVFQKYLKIWADMFEGWSPIAQSFWLSSFNAWLLRFSFVIAFFIILGGIILLFYS